MGAIYIPPEGTRYLKDDCFSEIEKEMLDLGHTRDYSEFFVVTLIHTQLPTRLY